MARYSRSTYRSTSADPNGRARGETREDAHGTESILLIEDDDQLRKTIRRVLESRGYTVIDANGSAEAIEYCESHQDHIDLVLSDMVMPGMSGPETVEHIRAAPTGCEGAVHVWLLRPCGFQGPVDPGASELHSEALHAPGSRCEGPSGTGLAAENRSNDSGFVERIGIRQMSQYFAPHTTQQLREKVLVVDDEVGIRILLTRLLTGWGYRVRHVEGAVAALEMMAAEPADILLSDVSMPEHDGLWLVQQVQAGWPQTAVVMRYGPR